MSTILMLALSVTPPVEADPGTYRWDAPPPQVQLITDSTPVPSDRGAIFVPSITGFGSEPPVLLVNGAAVTPIAVGRRVIVEPGRYVVLVGSADPALAVGVPVNVVAGTTAVLPVRWGALRVETVDPRLQRHDGEYDLIHIDSGRRIALSSRLGAEEGVDTWLLAPGLYRVTEPGAESFDRPGFLTVYVPPGAQVDLRVFMDKRTGGFRGGGVIPRTQVTEPVEEKDPMWSGALDAGVGGSATQANHVPGLQDSTTATASAFVKGNVDFRSDHHGVTVKANIDQGWAYTEWAGGDLPLFKAKDQLGGSAAYTFFFNKGTGLYARGGADTQLFDTFAIAPRDMEIAVRELDGTVDYRAVKANNTYKVADAFEPMVLQASAGLQGSLLNRTDLELSLRGGPGWRSYEYGGALVGVDNPNTDAVELDRIESFVATGAEASLYARARVTGWMSINSELGTFFMLGDLSRPIVEWDTTVRFRLTDIVSIDYDVDLDRVPRINDEWQLRHGASLTASWSVL